VREELVHLAVDDGVATVTLDSPANRNALSARLRRELAAHLDAAIDDPSARVIVLTHAGPAFCSGMDLKENRDPDVARRAAQEFPGLLRRLWTSPTPVLARLRGPARAGGLGLVAACDLVVAADDVTFAFTEVRIGAVPAMISVPVLARMSAAAAAELFLTGESFDAVRAARAGLINSAVPADELDAEVARYVGMLRLGAPGALAGTKELLHRERTGSFDGELAAMAEVSARYFTSDEAREGIRAFVEKRPPSWVAEG
jgi:methylglutaconyl-CoA hydratase